MCYNFSFINIPANFFLFNKLVLFFFLTSYFSKMNINIKELVEYIISNRSDFIWYNKWEECYESRPEMLEQLIEEYLNSESNEC